MRASAFVCRLLVTQLSATLVIVAFSTTVAGAAEPTVYRLPDATHASSLAVAPNGTVWFVPVRGTEWQWGGGSDSVVGTISPEGVVTEYEVPELGTITRLAIGPTGDIWVAGDQDRYSNRGRLTVGRLSSAGSLEAIYPVGREGWIGSFRAGENAVWFVRTPPAEGAPSTVEGISLTGAVRHIRPHQGCTAKTVGVSSGRTSWFAEMCDTARRGHRGGPRRAYLAKVVDGRVFARRRLGAEERVTSITVASDGTVWFGLFHKFPGGGYGYSKVGRMTAAGDLAEYRLRDGSLFGPLAVGLEGRVWFPSRFGRGYPRALNSIGTDGKLGSPICAAPGCAQEPSDLAFGPDGSLWYALASPNLNTGGGGSGIAIENEIQNEAGLVAHFVP